MSDDQNTADRGQSGDHAHDTDDDPAVERRANVRTRRASYWTIFLLAIAIFATSLVDMFVLDNALFWGVLAAYATLVVASIVLLFSRRVKDAPEIVEEYAVAEDAPSQAGEVNLRCTSCSHVFPYDEHVLATHAGWIQQCPNCELTGPLPKVQQGQLEGHGRGTGTPAANA